MSLGLITDSASDLAPETAEELGVGVVPLYVTLAGRRYTDWVQMTPEALYAAMGRGGEPETQPPEVEDFLRVYERHLGHYDRLISIHLSGEASLTAQRARQAAQLIAPKRVRVVDSRTLSGAVSAIVLRAAELARQGWEPEAVEREVGRIVEQGAVFFSVPDLRHLVRGGRLPKVGEALGNLLGLRPLLTVQGGKIRPTKAVRESKIPEALAQAVTQPFRGQRVRVSISHADADPDALERLKAALKDAPVKLDKGRVARMGGVITAHTGLGCIGIHAYPVA